MARRKNYGFEKKQRETRKQKKKDKKAARRGLTESANPEGDEAVDDSPPQPGPRDHE